MKKLAGNKKRILIVVTLLVVILLVGGSYALWSLTFRQTLTNVITTGCFKVEFKEKDPISLADTLPMTFTEGEKLVPYQFTITNICSNEVDYYINLETLSTESALTEGYLRASLISGDRRFFSDTLKDEYINKERVIDNATKAFMLADGTLLEKETKTFELRLWLDEDTPLSEETMNKTYQGKVTVTTTYVPDLTVRNMMIPMSIATLGGELPARNNTYTQNGKYKLSKVSFERVITDYENVVEVVDFSVDDDKSVQGYYVKDSLDASDLKYTLHIQANGKIQVNPNGYAYFSMPDDSEVVFVGIENIDTSFVENMRFMFYKYNGDNLDLSNFNTRNVVNMEHMFEKCTNLKNLDVHNFKTLNVTNMKYMFLQCSNLTNLDLSHFNTSKVIYMSGMFFRCSGLTSLDVSHFDTSQVISMESMFNECSNLTTLDVSHFDTDQVTHMGGMFFKCSSLTSLDVSHFDTSKVIDMNGMFYVCSSLTDLDVSHFNTSKVIWMNNMFSECNSLTSLDVSHFDTSQVTNMNSMFNKCNNIISLDVSHFNTSKVTNMEFMFFGCSIIKSLDLSNFDTGLVKRMNGMFASCSNLTTTINIRNTPESYTDIVKNAATVTGAKITFNYTNDTSVVVDLIIKNKTAEIATMKLIPLQDMHTTRKCLI